MLASAQLDALVDSCLMFCIHLKGEQEGSGVPVFGDRRSQWEPELYSAENKSKGTHRHRGRNNNECCAAVLPDSSVNKDSECNTRGSESKLGIIIRAQGAFSVCIIWLITVPCSNYSTAGTHSTLSILPTKPLCKTSVVNHTYTSTQKNWRFPLSFLWKSDLLPMLFLQLSLTSFFRPSSVLPWLILSQISGRPYWKKKQASSFSFFFDIWE